MSSSKDVVRELNSLATPQKAKASAWFFKTGPGQYGEGDQFIGVTMPEQRVVAKQFRDLPLAEIEELVTSPIHEHRMTGLIILVDQFKKADGASRKTIYDFYLAHTANVNNWDLVDGSAELIVGPYLQDKDKSILTRLAMSDLLWDRRIAMISTFHYIKQGDPTEAFKIAEILMNDKEDLMHKAVGWMLREVGKKCGREVLIDFLATHYQTMPRTALRYSIEHFDADTRQAYLKGKI